MPGSSNTYWSLAALQEHRHRRDVQGTDGGDAETSQPAVNDLAEFWEKNYAESFDGSFNAVQDLVSYNSESPSSPEICGGETYGNPNALFCLPDHLIAWDRGVLVPIGQQFFGDTSIAALLGGSRRARSSGHGEDHRRRHQHAGQRAAGGLPRGYVRPAGSRGSRPVSSSAPATVSITFWQGCLRCELCYAHAAVTRGHAELIATTRDSTYPTEDGEIPGGGSIVAAVATATGREPLTIGKPEPFGLELILRASGASLDEAVAIGY